MRTPARIVAASIAAALGLGLAAATADATTHTTRATSQGVSAKLIVHDVKNRLGKVGDKHWITLKVHTPAAAHDVLNGHDYGVLPVKWYATIRITGANSCTWQQTSAARAGSGTTTIPMSFTTNRSTTTTIGHYVTSGACKVSAQVVAYRYALNDALDVDADFTVRATGFIQSDVRTTTPHASATAVAKGHAIRLNGTVTYQKATAKVAYKWRAAPRGTKVVVQFKAKGTSSWKDVKAAKVGTNGRWATSVKVKKSGSYRVVSQATSHLQRQASASVAVRAR
ncbi:hypothetical protein [Cellulomonas edaphi]|uniref:Calcium-binding protein n=1 Tax=Cellulomonas edaphi TaxID=3053468 RepID=A0ABT7S690_9CELL|nr:hypothetical protein [Cellulomons edaphi]MDM7831132.1 hypothetical protein [Cellulomons edaphi]